MEKISYQYFDSPLGELIIASFQKHLCLCDWRYRARREQIDQRICKHLNADFHPNHNEIIEATKIQLTEYFEQRRYQFDLPLVFTGTEFQCRVWNELKNIPYGRCITYLQLSEILDCKESIRAVAAANGANALAIIIPCHRVVGKDNALVGYAGGKTVKNRLLQLERVSGFAQLEIFE